MFFVLGLAADAQKPALDDSGGFRVDSVCTINGSATIDHETARKRRFVAVEK
jgi:hypothetical protein